MYNSYYLTNISIMLIIVVICIGLICIDNVVNVDAQSNKKSKKESSIPMLRDSNLKIESIVDKLKFPSGMEFIGNDDLLVIEKNTGIVKRVTNGTVVAELLDLNVATKSERGLLGIAVLDISKTKHADKYSHNDKFVFLFVTETENQDDGNIFGNRVYRYDFVNGNLINPILLLDLPYLPGPSHNGGVMRIGPDNNLYIVMGDLNRLKDPSGDTIAQNLVGTSLPDGRGGVLRITPDGETVNDGFTLGDDGLLDKYYGYGVRNSFGIGFDNVTGYLWDTENGSHYGDEINIVKPGFNSGWRQVLGLSSMYDEFTDNVFDRNQLIDFHGNGKYYDPVLTWNDTIAPTTVAFIHSSTMGDEYKDDILVGGVKNGTILHFDLNQTRTGLQLEDELSDKLVNKPSEISSAIFGTGFDIITDIKIDPFNGDLYVLAANTKNG
ncbi:MAG TPA: PQQ-dependent sugar dehydrogenase, partial [Nitrososphaeraceae archaeon]|nr:PQQ-dependent sugar dehydrogenase [Nitrososphaeraceae archaeon]